METNASCRSIIHVLLYKYFNYNTQSQQCKDLLASRTTRDKKDFQAILSVTAWLIHSMNSLCSLFQLFSFLTNWRPIKYPPQRHFDQTTTLCTSWVPRIKFSGSLHRWMIIRRPNKIHFWSSQKAKSLKTWKIWKADSHQMKNKIFLMKTNKMVFSKIAIITQERTVDLKQLVHLVLSVYVTVKKT